jgi:hypothetical protein
MSAPYAPATEVTIVDIKMPFMSMVVFMIKWVIAAIPAFLILGLLSLMFSGVIAGMFMATSK